MTTRISVSSTDAEIVGQSAEGSVAANGGTVAFDSNADYVVPGLETQEIEG